MFTGKFCCVTNKQTLSGLKTEIEFATNEWGADKLLKDGYIYINWTKTLEMMKLRQSAFIEEKGSEKLEWN